MTTGFERKYTDAQRDAIAHAYEDRRIRPAARVVALAAAGELEHDGKTLEPFECTQNTVRAFAQKLRKQRRGELTSKLAHAAPRDAVEQLRRRLVNAADAMLVDLERDAKRADPERLRQITRAVREIAAIPGPEDPRPNAPGSKRGGTRNGAETQGGLAGAILKDARAGDEQPAQETAPDTPTHTDGDRDQSAENGTAPRVNTTEEPQDDGSPGSLARMLAGAMSGDALER